MKPWAARVGGCVAVLVLATGCSSPANVDVGPDGGASAGEDGALLLTPLRSFQAEVIWENRTFRFQFDGPVPVAIGPNSSGLFYRLLQAPSHIHAESTITYFLDQTLHVVRIDHECGIVTEDCHEKYRGWDARSKGRLAPFGILWPHALDSQDRLVLHRDWDDVVLDASVIRAADWVVDFAASRDDHTTGFDNLDHHGAYRYSDQTLVATEGPGYRLGALALGSELALADAAHWRTPALRPTPDPVAGMDARDFGLGLTLADVWAVLMNESVPADEWTRWRCVVEIDVPIPRDFQAAGPSVEQSVTTIEFTLGIGDSQASRHSVEVVRDVAGRTSARYVGSSDVDGPTFCDDRGQFGTGAFSLGSADDYRAEVAPSGVLSGVKVWTRPAWYTGPASAGAFQYLFVMTPQWAIDEGRTSSWSYTLMVDGDNGRLLRLVTHPDDIDYL